MSSKEIKIFYSLQIVSECCRQHPGLSLLVCLLHTTPACDLLAAVGACMYHILAAIHTEGDQATAKVTAESRNHTQIYCNVAISNKYEGETCSDFFFVKKCLKIYFKAISF